MKKLALILLISSCLLSCKSKQKVVTKKTPKTSSETKRSYTASESKLIGNVINNAEFYNGTRYKYGGTTKKGMDCSGLIYTAFKEEGVNLPRVSSDMAKRGDWIDLKKVKKGDLLFFATKKNSRRINHVGLVTSSRLGNVEFIHATTSKGVITSNLAERYWYFSFVQARRVL